MDRRLVVFGDDWGRHPSGTQHLIRGLMPRYRVDWINTIGTRRPQLTMADIQRGVEKVSSWLTPRQYSHARHTMPNAPRIYSPAHWPSFHWQWERQLNNKLLSRSLRPFLATQPPPVAVITAIPITADLAATYPELNWVYWCGDNFAEWPGLDGNTLRIMERDMLPYMRRIVVASENLKAHMASMGYTSHVLTLGIDIEHWNCVERKPLPRPPQRPVAMFWGMIDSRLDNKICTAVAKSCDLVMVGSRVLADAEWLHYPSVRIAGKIPYADLPKIACSADVLVMPYDATMPATQAMQPLKLKEYLATGLPVVATPLPATLDWSCAMDLRATPDSFAECVVERAHQPLPTTQREARRRLENERWPDKSRYFEELILRREK